jgi:hypothetical protein
MLKDFIDEYERYRLLGEKALKQIPDEALNQSLGGESNSAAVIVRHISGNLVSRFTDFLTSDGEKPWRDRESEFADAQYDRREVEEMWGRGWGVLRSALAALGDADLGRRVTIRGQPLSVHEALCRSLAHTASHVGQIVLVARVLHRGEWQSLSIPKGQSAQYNQNPTMEKKPE